jgi:NAD(P)-dependent dehydrogenase (short-subunit alcohol dehydrogenase family)
VPVAEQPVTATQPAGPRPGRAARLADAALEATVIGSFSRLGADLRPHLWPWSPLPDQHGRVVVVTGASSGIGRAAALALARRGASLWLLGRDARRTGQVASEASQAGAPRAEPVVLDLIDPDAVADLSSRLAGACERVDALVHAAGALDLHYARAPDGTERTVATSVLAPFRLTWALAPLLRTSPGADIVTVSSGGMYSERFDLDRLEMTPGDYRGATAYARAKRAQVVLAREWAWRWHDDGVASYSCHPGWVDTPGLRQGLPGFARLGPLLRSPGQGADTVAWLAAGAARPATQGFYFDRLRRSEHHLPWTRRSDDAGDGARLWAWCLDRLGLPPGSLPPEPRVVRSEN